MRSSAIHPLRPVLSSLDILLKTTDVPPLFRPQITAIKSSPYQCGPLLAQRRDVPVLVVAGLLDATPPAALALMRRLGPRSRLLLGPWNHMMNQQARVSGDWIWCPLTM